MSKQTIGVLGLGLFGRAVALTLTNSQIDTIAIDKNMDVIEELAEEIDNIIQCDFTKYDQLKETGIAECDCVIVAAGSHLEETIMAILNLQKMEVDNIIVKINNSEYKKVLLKLGATRVVLPEEEMGVRTAIELINPSVHELINLDNRYNVIEFEANPKWIGQSISHIDFRNEFKTNIIAIKSNQSNDYLVEFTADYIVKEGDTFIGITNNDKIAHLLSHY